MKKIILILLILTFYNLYSIESDKKSWVIAFSNFESEGLALNNQYLVSTLPTFIKDNIITGFEHYLTEMEVKGVYEKYVSKKIDELDSKRIKTLKSKDDLLFNGIDKDKYNKLEEELLEIETSIDEFNNTDFTKLENIDSLELEVKENIELPNGNHIQKFMEKNGIDYLFTGKLEEEAGNLFLNLYLFSLYEEDKEIIYSGIGNSEDILDQRVDMVNIVNQKIVNKTVIDYQISVFPEESLIYIGGEFKGIGSYKGYSFPGDEIGLKLLKDGFETVVTSKTVDDDNREFSFELLESELDTVKISTEPEGAKVHYGSKFIGMTPTEVPLLSNPQKLTLSLEGYMDKAVTINFKTKDMHFVMDSNVIDVDENFLKHKNNFYLSVGIFSVSLAVPLFLSSQSDMIATNNEYIEFMTNISAINATIWGAHFIYRLYKYLEAAKLSVE